MTYWGSGESWPYRTRIRSLVNPVMSYRATWTSSTCSFNVPSSSPTTVSDRTVEEESKPNQGIQTHASAPPKRVIMSNENETYRIAVFLSLKFLP